METYKDVYEKDVVLMFNEHKRIKPVFDAFYPHAELTDDERIIRQTQALELADCFLTMARQMYELYGPELSMAHRAQTHGLLLSAQFTYEYMYPQVEGSTRFVLNKDGKITTKEVSYD